MAEMGIASAATTISSVFLGKLGDRVGYRRVLIISLIIRPAPKRRQMARNG